MAGKAIQIIAGGVGVASAAPFTAGQYTIITSAPAPTITAGRLGQLGDAVQSIVAPDVAAPADLTSMALGSTATTRGALGSLVIGSAVKQTGAAGQGVKSVLIGGNIDPGAAATSRANIVYIGWDFTLTDGGSAHGSNVFIGQAISAAGGTDVGNAIAIGVGVSIQAGENVVIGTGAQALFGESVIIGSQALGSQSQSVGIGRGANPSTNSIAIGRRARSDQSSVAIGFFTDSLGDSGVVIGRDATNNGKNKSIVLGRSAAALVDGDCIIGGNPTYATLRLWIGPEFQSAYPGLVWQLTNSDFAGVDVVAPNATIMCGSNTGAGAGGELRIQTATILASGAVRQTLAERFAVIPSTGGLNKPTLRLSNITTTPGAAAGTLANATTAGNPTDWIPITINGNLRFIPAWP